jgi:hypothetical protein
VSFPVFTQARDSINKAYIALQGWNTNPTDIPLPDVVNPKRPHLTDEQIAARYLKSIEGNQNIDINNIPRMKSHDRIADEFPIADFKPDTTSKKRNFNCVEISLAELYHLCTSRPYFHFKQSVYDAAVKVDLFGDANPDCLCLEQLPIFFTCNDKYLEDTHDIWMEYRDQFLDFRNFSYLQTDKWGEQGVCHWRNKHCPKPETSQMAINHQIDEAIESGLQTNIYLNQTMLDDYLIWRKYNSKPENFTYVVVADRSPVVSTPINTGIIAAGVAAAVAGMGIISLIVRSAVNYSNSGKRSHQNLQRA